MDILWSSTIGGTVLRRERMSSGTETNNSLVYTDNYTISSLAAVDVNRVIRCEGVINAPVPVMASDFVILNVISRLNYCVLYYILYCI